MKLSSKNKNQKKFKGMKQKWENLRDYYTEFGYHYFFNLDSCLCVQGGYETEPKKKENGKMEKGNGKRKRKRKRKAPLISHHSVGPLVPWIGHIFS